MNENNMPIKLTIVGLCRMFECDEWAFYNELVLKQICWLIQKGRCECLW